MTFQSEKNEKYTKDCRNDKRRTLYIFLILKYTRQLGFSGGSAGEESACNVGDLGLIPRLERSPGEGKGYP